MASKKDILLHLDAISACESKDYQTALNCFQKISDPTAPIIFNIGSCYLMLGRTEKALAVFNDCLSRDKYMAIGYFQHGIAECLCCNYSSAISSFNESVKSLRGNTYLDYKQLNMPCKLYACEINYNHAIVLLMTGDYEGAKTYMLSAGTGSMTDASRRSFIADGARAVCANNMEYFGTNPRDRLLWLPGSAFYRVSKNKSDGLKASTNFMPEAKVVAAASAEHTFTGFVGARNLPQPGDGTSPQRKRIGGIVVGPPPSVPPPRLPPSPKRPQRVTKPNSPGALSELQDRVESRLYLEDKKAVPCSQADNEKVSLNVHCELKINLSDAASLDEVILKIQNKLEDWSTNLPKKLQQQQFSMSVGSQSNIKSDREWMSAWSAACNSGASDVSLSLKENDQSAGSDVSHRKGFKPSRPPPKIR